LHALQCLFAAAPPTYAAYTLPYTTLFRSLHRLGRAVHLHEELRAGDEHVGAEARIRFAELLEVTQRAFRIVHAAHQDARGPELRSEEHTSELQSRENLVCRLLLEKKKTTV